jgi:hypothetical protein
MYEGRGKAEAEEDSAGFLSSMGSMAPKSPAPDTGKYEEDAHQEGCGDEGGTEGKAHGGNTKHAKAQKPVGRGFMAAELSAAAYDDERRQMEKESKIQTKSTSGLSSSTSTSTSTSSVKVKGTTVKGHESSSIPPSVSERIVGDFAPTSMDAEVKRSTAEASQTAVTSDKESDSGGGGVASTDDDGGYGDDEFEDF